MNNSIKKIVTLQVLVVMILLILPGLLHAQSSPGPEPDSAPVDGGLSLLVAGGIGYGVRKMREKRNTKKDS